MEKDWVKIYATSDVVKAEMVKNFLQGKDIQAVIINKRDSSLIIGEAELYVKQEDVLKATHLIKNVFDA
ncbi:MAG TPA: DUF2007 domain-containing protein [Chitinophagales bacterium]|nr:DUF2007 domain-containing protein [Chitinophagales bacterium]